MRRRPAPGPGARRRDPRRTLPLAVPPLTPIRKGSPPLGCWWFCRVCSLSPAMAGAAPPPAAADGRTFPARARVGLPRCPAAAAGRCPGPCEPLGARPWGCLSRRRREPASSPQRPARFTAQAEVSVMLMLQSGRAARCYSPRRRRRGGRPQPPPLPGPAAATRGLPERCEPGPPPPSPARLTLSPATSGGPTEGKHALGALIGCATPSFKGVTKLPGQNASAPGLGSKIRTSRED